MRATGFGASLAALVMGIALTACTGDDPQPDPTPIVASPTESPSESPTPTDSATPQTESAKEFIRRFVDVQNRATVTGDFEKYLKLAKSCSSCRESAKRISGFYEAGGWVKTDGWTVESISRNTSRDFYFDVTSAPTKYRDSSDATVMMLDGGAFKEHIFLARRGGSWIVEDLLQVSQ